MAIPALLVSLALIAQFQEADRFEASAGQTSDRFGSKIALDGDTLVVGAHAADDADPATQTCISGAAYVFERSPGGWIEEQRLLASDIACRSAFGDAVDISGDTIAIGSSQHDGGSFSTNCNGGAVYIFTRTGSAWVEQQILRPGDSDCGQWFGSALAIEGDTLVVGAPRDDEFGTLSGAAYVFVKTGGTWVEREKLRSTNERIFDGFGSSVAICGDLLVVGAQGAGPQGEAYVFERSAGVWTERQQVDSGGGSPYGFGSDVAISGNTFAVSATGGNNRGAVYVFDQVDGAWSLNRTFYGPAGSDDPYSYYGLDIDLQGDTLVVGEYGEDDAQPGEVTCMSGTVHVYTRTGPLGTEWALDRLLANPAVCGEYFGVGVALDQDTLIAGAENADGILPRVGVCHAFERTPVGSSACFGIGCPCGNDYPTAGCANSTGRGAVLMATGSTSVVADDLRIRATGLPRDHLAIFAVGTAGPPTPMGAGLLCVDRPGLLYHQQLSSSWSGATVVLSHPVASSGGFLTAGSSVLFQCIYRDGTSSPCGARANVSSGLSIQFTP